MAAWAKGTACASVAQEACVPEGRLGEGCGEAREGEAGSSVAKEAWCESGSRWLLGPVLPPPTVWRPHFSSPSKVGDIRALRKGPEVTQVAFPEGAGACEAETVFRMLRGASC